jgi:hypothetical protein
VQIPPSSPEPFVPEELLQGRLGENEGVDDDKDKPVEEAPPPPLPPSPHTRTRLRAPRRLHPSPGKNKSMREAIPHPSGVHVLASAVWVRHCQIEEKLAETAAKSRAEVLEMIGDIPDADMA